MFLAGSAPGERGKVRRASPGARRAALGFRKRASYRHAKSKAADERYLGRWFGALFVLAREGGLYRCLCLCGAERLLEARRIITRSHSGIRMSCGTYCPLNVALCRRRGAAMNRKRWGSK